MDIFEPHSNQSVTGCTAEKFKSGNGTRLIPDTILRNSSNNNSQSSKGRNTETFGSKTHKSRKRSATGNNNVISYEKSAGELAYGDK